MKTKITTLLLACGTVVASPLSLNAQDVRPPGPETIKPAQPNPPPPPSRPDGGGKPDGNRRPDAKRDEGRDRDHSRKDNGPREQHEGERDRERSGGRDGRDEHRERPKAPETKPVTYLGLLARALSPEVAAQAGLPEGFGLLVTDVMKDSPAKAAGFEKYDVIVLLGDQRIVNLQQFQALIRAQKKGDEVTVSVRRKGADVKVSARLGEHVMPVEGHPHGHPMMGHGRMGSENRPPFGHPGFSGTRERMDEVRSRMEHFRKEMRERFEHRRDGEGKGGPEGAGCPVPFPPPRGMGHGPMNHGDHQGQPNMQRGGDRDRDHSHGSQQGPGPRAEGPRDKGPRPDGPPQGGPRPGANNGPRPEGNSHREGDRPGPGPRDGEAHRDDGRPAAPPPPGGALPPPRA